MSSRKLSSKLLIVSKDLFKEKERLLKNLENIEKLKTKIEKERKKILKEDIYLLEESATNSKIKKLETDLEFENRCIDSNILVVNIDRLISDVKLLKNKLHLEPKKLTDEDLESFRNAFFLSITKHQTLIIRYNNDYKSYDLYKYNINTKHETKEENEAFMKVYLNFMIIKDFCNSHQDLLNTN